MPMQISRSVGRVQAMILSLCNQDRLVAPWMVNMVVTRDRDV